MKRFGCASAEYWCVWLKDEGYFTNSTLKHGRHMGVDMVLTWFGLTKFVIWVCRCRMTYTDAIEYF